MAKIKCLSLQQALETLKEVGKVFGKLFESLKFPRFVTIHIKQRWR